MGKNIAEDIIAFVRDDVDFDTVPRLMRDRLGPGRYFFKDKPRYGSPDEVSYWWGGRGRRRRGHRRKRGRRW